MSFPTDPTESYEGSEFGFGPFQTSGGSIVIPTAHPHRAGYGGSAYDGGIFSGSAYGMRAYGDVDISQAPHTPLSSTIPFTNQGFGGTQYGQNPYGLYAQAIPLTAYPTQSFNTVNSGFGGDLYGNFAYGSGILGGVPRVFVGGYGQSESGGEPYGNGLFPVSPFSVSGGYGGDPFGLGPYGSIEFVSPYLASAISLNGFEIELFFSEEMEETANLLNPSTYELLSIVGGESEIVSIRVGSRELSDAENLDFSSGVLSIIITHTGTMLGGTYKIRVVEPIFDLSGNAIPIEDDVDDSLGQQPNEVRLLTKGQAPSYSIQVVDGDTLLVDFEEDILSESDFPNGVENPLSYSFSNGVSFPIEITVDKAEHYNSPINNNRLDQVELSIKGMTSIPYQSVISDSLAFDYQGNELPSESTDFVGTELGTGTSSAISFLSLTKSVGDTYGWRFEDSSGKVVPITSTYQFDISIDVSNTVFTPSTGSLFSFIVDDGNIKITLDFQRVGSDDYLSIDGISVVQVDWSSAETRISVIRNQKADVYVFIVNGTPLASIPFASFLNVGSFIGAEIILASAVDVLNFHLLSLTANSSNTVYSKSWNFLHNVIGSFVGSAELAKDSFLTRRGPLVKGWGDHTLATKKDVSVRVEGVEIEVASVNPYIGEITTVIPIPLMPIGTMTVEVDYEWFATPKIEMGGLNTLGSVLNKFDLRRERNTTSLINGERGSADTSRFTMGLVLPYAERTDPLYIGHRYLGFVQDYTASLNSPTSLLLNQNPHSIAVDRFEKNHAESVCTYEGTIEPSNESWGIYGTDNGSIEVGEGTYNLQGNKALYYKDDDLTFDSAVNTVARFQVLSHTLNGVFTGVGFGFHNNHQLFFVGALVINGVKHIGLLKDSQRLDLISSWDLAFTVSAEIVAESKIRFASTGIPIGMEVNDRFQILDGTQSGTYTISEIVTDTRFGLTTLIIKETFPSDYKLFGNAFFDVVFEIDHSDRNTYRLVCDHTNRSAELYISGDVSGYGLVKSDITRVEPIYNDLDTSKQGQVFWGNLDPNAVCSTSWSFFRYSISPTENKKVSFGHRVFTELGDLPQSNPNAEWFLENSKGQSDISSGSLILNSVDDGYVFTRTEPFLTNKADTDVAIKIKSEFQTSGADTFVEVWDTLRSVELAFITYIDPSPMITNRTLIDLPSVSVIAEDLSFKKEDGISILDGVAEITSPILDTSNLLFTDTLERKAEIRFAVEGYSFDSSGYADFSVEIQLKNYTVFLSFTNGFVSLRGDLSENAFAFNWADNQPHTYKVIFTSGNISLSVDNVVLGNVSVSALSSPFSDRDELLRYTQNVSRKLFNYICFHLLPPSIIKKTLGVYLGGDRSDINSWELPRTDSSSDPNSYDGGAVIQEIDWVSDYQEIRIHRDVTWGVTVLIDNLGSPPYYNGEYATDITIPSAGWINVEYARLPRKRLDRNFGYIQFGSHSISQQKIDWVRYRLFDHPFEDYKSPQGMVLNNYNVISSGETLIDTTPEVLEIVSLDKNHILLSVSHIYSDFIYKILVNNAVVDENEWSFNENTQLITLNEGILTTDHQAVTVVCRINDRPTTTYLEKQPLLESMTLLNEGTPSFAKSRLLDSIRTIKSATPMGDTVSVEGDPLTGIVSSDTHKAVGFENSDEDLYESLSFTEVTNEGDTEVISSICDSPFAEHGLREIALSGRYFYEKSESAMPYPKFNQGGGFPSTFLFASGGSKQLGGTTNNTQTLTYPLANSGTQNRTFLYMRYSGYSESIDLPTTTDVPTSHSSISPSATTTSGGCFITISQASSVSKIGPWGGISSLTPSGNQQVSVGGVSIGTPFSTSSLLNGGIVLQGGSKLPIDFEHSQILEQA